MADQQKDKSPSTEKVVEGDAGLQNLADLTRRVLEVPKKELAPASKQREGK